MMAVRGAVSRGEAVGQQSVAGPAVAKSTRGARVGRSLGFGGVALLDFGSQLPIFPL